MSWASCAPSPASPEPRRLVDLGVARLVLTTKAGATQALADAGRLLGA